jgi:hypothetical protein
MRNKIRRTRLSLITCFLLVSGALYAQLPEIPIPVPKYEYDTNYIVNFDNLLAIRFVIPRRTFNFQLKNPTTDDKIIYRPNLQTAFGLGITYRWLAFDIVVNPKFNKSKTERFGATNEFNIKGTIYLKRHLLDGMFRIYNGMHIANPTDYLDPWDGVYYYRPDLRSINVNLSYTIPFNSKEYAPRTAFLLDGRMKKSAGSFMYMAALTVSSLAADSSIVPAEYEYAFEPKSRIDGMGFLMIQQSFGYAHTFIYRKYYLTLSAMPGVSYNYGNVYSEGGTYHPSSLDFMFESKNSLGFNSRKWYAGVYYIFKYQNLRVYDNLNFNSSLGELRFFIGYRIKAPYVVNKFIPK